MAFSLAELLRMSKNREAPAVFCRPLDGSLPAALAYGVGHSWSRQQHLPGWWSGLFPAMGGVRSNRHPMIAREEREMRERRDVDRVGSNLARPAAML